MKNRKLILILSLVLALTMSLGGTLAYLTDTDSDVNTMVLGNVKIEQHEYERVPDGNGGYEKGTVDNQESYLLQDFTQDKPLLPIVGDPNEIETSPAYAGFDGTGVRMTQVGSYGTTQVLAGKNAVDKFVTVENTGNTPAYVRTYIAVEVGSTENKNPHAEGKELVVASARATDDGTGTMPWLRTNIGIVEINGNYYDVDELVYRGANDVNRHVNGVLPAKDTTYPSLYQVYVKHQANNEDLQNLDGNNNGKLDILVLSQAVQADGFAATAEKSAAQVALEAGFGKATDLNENGLMNVAAWFGGDDFAEVPVVVENAAAAKDAIDAGESNITISSGEMKIGDLGLSNETVTINGTKDTVIDVTGANGLNGSNVTFNGVTIQGTTANYQGLQHSGKIVFENCVINDGMFQYGTEVVFKNCVFNLSTNYLWTYGAGKVTFDNCTFNTNGKGLLVYNEQAATAETLYVVVNNCTFNASAKGYTSSGDWCAAVEIGTGTPFNVAFTGKNVVSNNFSNLWRDKGQADNNLVVVTVNGETVHSAQ